jgi:CheY-like chemotaxis protein
MSANPTVYFIDDSATMREVIKIAFRRENMNVVATHDAAHALEEIEQTRPDIVITDVIMPETDGYEVCQFIKTHPELARTPVILMSGVVNRMVAERAFSVKADELLRKPFQPQDLITRVRHLLNQGGQQAPNPAAAVSAAAALSAIFSSAPPVSQAPALRTVDTDFSVTTAAEDHFPLPVVPLSGAAAATRPTNGDPTKLKVEVLRLQGLVKKLQAELQAEREYARALEAHVKTLQEA